MRIKPILFNYGKLVEDMGVSNVKVLRKNVVVENEVLTAWGKNVDRSNGIMMLTSISIKREYTKNSKLTITDLWESLLSKYVIEQQPEEIMKKIDKRKVGIMLEEKQVS